MLVNVLLSVTSAFAYSLKTEEVMGLIVSMTV